MATPYDERQERAALRRSELKALLVDWVSAESARIWDRSGDITGDLVKLYEHARGRALILGIAWSEDVFDETDMKTMRDQ